MRIQCATLAYVSDEFRIPRTQEMSIQEHAAAVRGTTGSVRYHTINSLRLDLDAARAGRTWRLLPEGFRHQEAGGIYPLPRRREDLQKLAEIVVQHGGQDSGVIYLKRAFLKWRSRASRIPHSVTAVERAEDRIRQANHRFNKKLAEEESEVRRAVERIHEKVQEAAATLTDLFALGRRGLAGQMEAHLNGSEWQGEKINSRAFRECFRMVAQAVKGLGLPSDQRQAATATIMEEVASALEDTQAAVALAPGSDDETPQ